MKLDVGCGNRPTGDVNVDLYINEETLHLDTLNRPKLVESKNTKNPVKADAHYLPFKDGSFGEVYSNHVLEHLENPTQALREMLRVSRYKVVFKIPHRLDMEQRRALKLGTHKHVFTTGLVKHWLTLLGVDRYHLDVRYAPPPHRLLKVFRLIWFPSEIKVEIWK